MQDGTGQGGSVRRNPRARRAQRFGVWVAALVGIAAVHTAPLRAEEASRQQMQSLDEQVQEIKSDVLGIAAELNRLEERLLYPSDTQVAVFVSLKEGEKLRIDSVAVQIDGAPVARHIYSFQELEALQKGGVQRLYTGNVATGDHRIDVVVNGKLPSGADFTRNQSFSFNKKVEPKLVGITLADAGDASIQLGAW